jgi:ankyrin repeat protein
LLDAGVSIDQLSDDHKLLAATQSVGVLRRLLARDDVVDVPALRDQMGQSFFHLLLRQRIADARLLLSALFEHRPSTVVDVLNSWRITPFSQAVSQDHADAVRLFVEMGADVDQLDFQGCTALQFVCSSWRSTASLLQLLLALGASLSIGSR